MPSGTVTFLLTDIEDSSGLWERSPKAMRAALGVHDTLVAEVVAHHGGAVVKHLGDGCWAVFASAPGAAAAAIDFQRHHQQAAPEAELSLKVRIGLHTGDVEPTEGDYFGPVVNRAARIVDLANGNQIVCSASTAGLLPGADLRSEGLHELRGIGTEEVFLLRAEGFDTDPQPLRLPVRPTNLPRTHNAFLGRESELDATLAFLERHAVVTLVGPGGVGKTRLAIEAGARIAKRFEEHVYFCDLVPIAAGDTDAVAEAVAEIVGARRQPGMSLVHSIADHLSGRPGLIILDNCEHVLGAVREIVGRLAEAEGVQVLATSRAALDLTAEQQLLLDPLSAETAGVELFVDRATHRDPYFQLTGDNEAAVLDVVHRLDGIPLAIELAAARIRLMTPAELAQRLDDDGLRVLGDPGARERHETLRGVVRWSYDLLSPGEASLFARLSVFAGGFGLDAVEAVCGDDAVVVAEEVPDLMMGLVDKSMVVSRRVGGHQRFSLLDTLRAFAAEELAGTDSGPRIRRRHADHFGGVATRQGDRLFGPAEPDAWRILDEEWSNLRTALDTFESENDLDGGADLVVALVWYAGMAMRFEAFAWAEEILEAPRIESHPSYTALCGAAALGAYFTVHDDPTAWAEAGLAADPSDREGFCHAALAAVAMNNVQSAEAAAAITEQWLDSDPSTVGGRLWAEAFRTFYLCSYAPGPQAAVHADAVSALAEETGSITANALAAWARGQVVSYQDMRQAMDVWTAGREWSRSLPGDHLIEHLIEGLILHHTVDRSDLATALRGCRDAVRGALERHYHAGTSHLFGVTATALCRAGDAETGARLVGAMLENGHHLRPEHRPALEHALGDELETHLARGTSLSITQAAHIAIEALESAIERLEGQPA